MWIELLWQAPRLRAAEVVLAFLVVELIVLVAIGSFVRHGGSYLDDWWMSAYVAHPQLGGYPNALDYLMSYSQQRPGSAFAWLALFKLAGVHFGILRAASLVFAGLAATAFYALLRELRLERIHAVSITLLALLFPLSDSVRFWIIASISGIGIAAYLAGAVVALRAFDAPRRRGRRHALSLLLYALSLSMAESMLVPIALSALLYRLRAPWRKAAARWAADLLLVVVALVHLALNAPPRRQASGSPGHALARAGTIADQALSVFTSSLAPLFAVPRGVVLAVLVAVAAFSARLASRVSGTDAIDAARIRRCFWILCGGVVGVAAGYAIYLPAATDSYLPLQTADKNRVNVVAALPMSALVVASLALLAALVSVGRLSSRRGTIVYVALVIGTAGVFCAHLRRDEATWIAAAQKQNAALGAMRTISRPQQDSAIMVFGSPGYVRRVQRFGNLRLTTAVSVFSTWWESLGAARVVAYPSGTVAAYYVSQSSRLVCRPRRAYYIAYDGVLRDMQYGRLYFMDPVRGVAATVTSQASCKREQQHFAAGPYVEDF